MIGSIDSTIVATALHEIQEGLDTNINLAGWTVTAYALGLVVMLPLSGRLSERFGKRRIFIWSVGVFTVASLLCGLAENIYTLVALRTIQALGGAGFTPAATGIIVDYFGKSRDRAIGLFGSIFPIGAMIGPALGGILVDNFSWRSIFLINIPIGVLTIILAKLYIPKDRKPRFRLHFPLDLYGMLLVGVAVISVMLLASYLGGEDVYVWSATTLVLTAIFVISLVMFFYHIKRARHPFIMPKLIYGRGFGSVNLINVIFVGVTLGSMTLAPLYAINHYGFSPLSAGTLLIAQGLASVFFTSTSAFLLRFIGYRLPIYVGGVLMASGIMMLSMSPRFGIDPYFWLLIATFIVGCGSGTINPATRNAGLQLEPQHSALLAAIRTMGIQVGSILTVSIVTAVLASFHDSYEIQSAAYKIASVLIVISLPLAARVPQHKGVW